ncbi:MAG: hypothetical protein K6E62_11740, partial [Lachnospiraceae bacterium]|nr:hypothetical protein [Lachnospiraceae bacterium]
LYTIRHTIRNEVNRKFYVYDVYLADNCPYHDILTGICQEVYAEDEYPTEAERLKNLKALISKNIKNAMDFHDAIIMECYPSCEEMCIRHKG